MARLTAAGYPLPALLAIEELSKAFKFTAADTEDFAAMFSEFLVAHGALDQQAHFTDFVITFVEQRLPHHRQANGARRHAHAAEEVHNAVAHAQPVAAAAIAPPH